jgi:AcrR family transcriptional regulator
MPEEKKMLKPLTKEQTERILMTAAEEFANGGYAHTSISAIARKSGVSVGVIYKYYEDKADLFKACVVKCLESLDEVFEQVHNKGLSLMDMADELIAQVQIFARKHPEYFRLYHQITVTGSSLMTPEIAELIEGRSARLYSGLLKKACESGEVRSDMDPSLFAFFFDNLLMMLHFSYTCGYYENRFRIFCGDDVTERDKEVREQMLKFIGGALNGVHISI